VDKNEIRKSEIAQVYGIPLSLCQRISKRGIILNSRLFIGVIFQNA
jgi:hypothetical protein